MSLRAWRLALVFLVALTACGPLTPVADAATRHRVHSTRKGSVAKRTGRRHHGVRRAPPGGVYARCAVVMDPATGKVLYDKNADRSAPIASISKLMSVMVFLEQKPDLTREVEVTREEIYGGSHTQLRDHEIVSLNDLLHMSLMCSDNVATRVLARESGLAKNEFVARMNARANEMGLKSTHFVEPTGLDQNNVSSAADVAKMLQAAAGNPLTHSIMTTQSYEFATVRRVHLVNNTNRLLKSRYQVLGGKTGYINQSGYCFATWLRADGRDLIAVVLGAPTNATRFADVVRLIQRTTAPQPATAVVKS